MKILGNVTSFVASILRQGLKAPRLYQESPLKRTRKTWGIKKSPSGDFPGLAVGLPAYGAYRILIISAITLFIGTEISHSHYNTEDSCVPAGGDPIILGVIFPQQSLFSAQSILSYQGAEAMREAVNECGGIKGRPIAFVYEPASDRASAESAAQTLIGQGIALIIGSGLSAVSEGASAVAQEAGVVYWDVTDAPPVKGDWIFSLAADFQQLGAAAANFAQSNFREPRVALIYEERRALVAEGVREGVSPIIDYTYADEMCCQDAYALAERLREARVNIVILSVFDRDGERLWNALREADAKIEAWVHVGSEGYRRDICRSANSEGFISVNTAGPVSEDYRNAQIGEIYDRYRATYRAAYGDEPEAAAHLGASGVYMLLRYVLPRIEGDITAESIRAAAQALDFDNSVGLMGEGLAFDANGVNRHPAAIVRQQQGRGICSIWPESIATCTSRLEFPTWRERALAVESQLSCDGEM
jgi:branched-chain amino acid transport system substrate-binding protein